MYSILYVDDEADLLELGKQYLESSHEFSLDTKISARDGLQALKLHHYDAIISDYMMPEMNGIAFLKEVRSSHGDIPFIIFTGRGREEVVIEALNNGADFYLQKSSDPDIVFTELKHVIRRAVLVRETQYSIAEQEQRYHDLQNANDLIQSVAPDGHFLFVNQKWLDTLGYQESEVENLTIFDIIHEESLEHCKVLFPRVISGENVGIIDVTFKSRDGTKVYAEGMASCKITEGKPQYTRGIFKNVTDRKLTEEALRESEEKFRALAEHSLDGILITDFTGNLLFANRAAGRIVEATDYEAMIGTRNVLEFIAPESRADVLRDFGQVLQGIDAYLVTYKLITEKKREIWVECIGKKIPFRESGAIVVSMRDVTERMQAEAALRESENKFATVFRSSPVALTLVSAMDGTFVDVNDAFVRGTGYSRDEVIGKTSEALGLFTDNNERKRLASSLRDQRCVYSMEMHCRIKTGEIRTCLFSSGLIMMGGKPHILSTIEDATGRKASESALQAMVRSMVGTTGLDSLKKITENVSSWLGAECVMVGEIQPDRETVKVLSMLLDGKEIPNYFYTLKGTPCDNVAEKGFCLYPDNAIQLFPESRDLVDLNIRGYIGTPLRDSGGQVLGILCALSRSPIQSSPSLKEIMDVIAVKAAAEIERTRMERALRESQELLAEAMDLAHLVNWEYDVGTGIFTFDDRFYALYGTMAEREGGYRMPADVYAREFVHPDDRGVVAEEVEKAKKTTDPHYVSQREHRIIRRDGEIRHILVRIGITKDGAGRTIKTHGANQDITDRKRAEDALRTANRQLSLLTGITRHDILNKISIVLGYLNIAEKKFTDPELEKYLGKMESATTAIRSEIEFTRVYQDLGTHEPQWLELDTVMPRSLIPAAITLNANVPGIFVFADPMLEKVFFNLLDNSIRHGQRVTEIRVSSHQSDEDLVVVWGDNGIGIAADEKEKIFERGFGKNTGLGMFLAREILALTGIAITETGEPGSGARFEIVVPKGTYRSLGKQGGEAKTG
jgi:PAS domain S-box-containing protein